MWKGTSCDSAKGLHCLNMIDGDITKGMKITNGNEIKLTTYFDQVYVISKLLFLRTSEIRDQAIKVTLEDHYGAKPVDQKVGNRMKV